MDGGASVSDILMQIQADLLRLPVDRPAQVETTAFGAAALAGLAAGVWKSFEEAGGPAPQPVRVPAPAGGGGLRGGYGSLAPGGGAVPGLD